MPRIFISLLSWWLLISCNNQPATITGSTKDSTTMDTNFKPLDWVPSTNIYEVNLRQYTQEGTFNAFANELPRLRDMGVKTLWFMPITPISQKGKKGSLGSYYACSDYTAINPEFGTLEDFKKLVKTAHEQGFKVIIDWVANHTGWDHRWTREHPEYYQMDPATKDFKIASGMDDIIELDFKNPELVKAMIEAMKFWVEEADIDGFRCDLAFWVELPFWQKARKEIDAVKPLFWFAETDEWDNPEYFPTFDVGYTWKWMHTTKEFYQQKHSIDSLDKVLAYYTGTRGLKSWFTTNHDENSWNGTEYEKYGEMAAALAVLSMTWDGVPLVYSGQELPNKKRLKFFDRDPIEWTGTNKLHDFYKQLLQLHSTHPALRAGDPEAVPHRIATSAGKEILAFLRTSGNRQVLVLLNLSTKSNLRFDITDSRIKGVFRNAISGAESDFTSEKSFEMQEWEWLVYVN